jgi:hypothetical protein
MALRPYSSNLRVDVLLVAVTVTQSIPQSTTSSGFVSIFPPRMENEKKQKNLAKVDIDPKVTPLLVAG